MCQHWRCSKKKQKKTQQYQQLLYIYLNPNDTVFHISILFNVKRCHSPSMVPLKMLFVSFVIYCDLKRHIRSKVQFLLLLHYSKGGKKERDLNPLKPVAVDVCDLIFFFRFNTRGIIMARQIFFVMYSFNNPFQFSFLISGAPFSVECWVLFTYVMCE